MASVIPPGTPTDGVIENNKVGMWWHAANYWVAYLKNNPDFQWATAINPMRVNRGAVLRGNHLAMYAGAKEKDAAWTVPGLCHDAGYRLPVCADGQLFHCAHRELETADVRKATTKVASMCCTQTEIDQYELPDNQPQPIFPGYQESTFKIGAQLMEAYLGTKTPAEALAQAEKDGNEVLAQTLRTVQRLMI